MGHAPAVERGLALGVGGIIEGHAFMIPSGSHGAFAGDGAAAVHGITVVQGDDGIGHAGLPACQGEGIRLCQSCAAGLLPEKRPVEAAGHPKELVQALAQALAPRACIGIKCAPGPSQLAPLTGHDPPALRNGIENALGPAARPPKHISSHWVDALTPMAHAVSHASRGFPALIELVFLRV